MGQRAHCCVECLLKTGAFIGALMSVAILCLSTVVLISSINNTRHANETETEVPPTTFPETDIVAPQNNTNFMNVIIPSLENATDHVYSPLGNHSDETGEVDPTTQTQTTLQPIIPSSGGIIEETMNVSVLTSSPIPPSSSSPPTLMTPTPSLSFNTSGFTSEEEESDIDNDNILNNNTSTLVTSTSSLNGAEAKPENGFFERQHDLWKDKTDTYIILMQASSGVGIFAALLQLFFSFILICGSQKDLRDRTTLWNLSNFIVLILSIVIILLPFSYNNATDTFKRGSVFWRMMIDSLSPQLFSQRTLEIVWNNFGNFLTKNFALYYYVVGMNSFLLLAFLIPPFISCLCLPCRRLCCKRKQYDANTESDLMLFETGGDPFKYYD